MLDRHNGSDDIEVDDNVTPSSPSQTSFDDVDDLLDDMK